MTFSASASVSCVLVILSSITHLHVLMSVLQYTSSLKENKIPVQKVFNGGTKIHSRDPSCEGESFIFPMFLLFSHQITHAGVLTHVSKGCVACFREVSAVGFGHRRHREKNRKTEETVCSARLNTLRDMERGKKMTQTAFVAACY